MRKQRPQGEIKAPCEHAICGSTSFLSWPAIRHVDVEIKAFDLEQLAGGSYTETTERLSETEQES